MSTDKINLLLVDDEEEFLKAIRRSLEVRDFVVFTANRGEEALEIARTNPVDIAVVDLKMPGMDGIETLEALKKAHSWMEIVILTGHGTIDSALEATRSGAYSYLQKPCELEKLMEVIVEAYKKRVMNKQQIKEKRLNELLKISQTHSAREILSRLREIDRQG